MKYFNDTPNILDYTLFKSLSEDHFLVMFDEQYKKHTVREGLLTTYEV